MVQRIKKKLKIFIMFIIEITPFNVKYLMSDDTEYLQKNVLNSF